MCVGVLLQYFINEFKYNLIWSVDGLVNEYCYFCEVLCDGVKVVVDLLVDIEYFLLDGVEYEVFNIFGGFGMLCEMLVGCICNFDYKLVCYFGYQQCMKFLFGDLGLKYDQELFKNILCKVVFIIMQDVVLVFVIVSGMCGDKFVQEVFICKIFVIYEEGYYESVIQSIIVFGVCMVVDLFWFGKLLQCGFISQEVISLLDFLVNCFGWVYV